MLDRLLLCVVAEVCKCCILQQVVVKKIITSMSVAMSSCMDFPNPDANENRHSFTKKIGNRFGKEIYANLPSSYANL